MKTLLFSILLSIGGLIAGWFAGYVLWFCVTIFMGAGHGSYLPARLLFPYTMAATHWGDHRISGDGFFAGLVSFAAYGAIIGAGLLTRHRKSVALAILAIHAVAVVVCFGLSDSSFD